MTSTVEPDGHGSATASSSRGTSPTQSDILPPAVGSKQPGDDMGGADSESAKKKRKKRKTPAQKRAAAAEAAAKEAQSAKPAPPVLKISRNKHMKYISSYHGPWLQLPREILESLLDINCDTTHFQNNRQLMDARASPYDHSRFRALPLPLAHLPAGDRRLPPTIDPAVFRGVTKIRQLVEEACDLSVRASSGMSAAALGAFGSGAGPPEHQGMGSLGGGGGRGGREAMMSPVRQQRLRALAVGKLAEAYRIDEIAASVCVMQSSTGLDDLAQRVLRYDSANNDALYVQFFHDKIPSRTLAASTDTAVLDRLILAEPNRLEFYRTRGVVHGIKQDYSSAIRNFTQALVQAKAMRKLKQHHAETRSPRRKKKASKPGKEAHSDGDATNSDAGSTQQSPNDEAAAIGQEAGDDIERQLLFHRGMSYFHLACEAMEDVVLTIEGVPRPTGGFSNEGGELTLRNIGIVLTDEPSGLYGCADLDKKEAYRRMLSAPATQDKVTTSLRRSLRDMERFLAYFSIWNAPASIDNNYAKSPGTRAADKPLVFRGRRLIHHRALSNRIRLSDPRRRNLVSASAPPILWTTYHPLLIEAHFCVLLCRLLLGDFSVLVTAHTRAIRLMDTLEGHPAFLPARSLNQSSYAEILERLATTWLPQRVAKGITTPIDTEEDLAQMANSLAGLHHIVNFFTPEYTAELAKQQEEDDARRRTGEQQRAGENRKGHRLALVDAEGKKIDPPYAMFNTARAEVALAWLSAVILPLKEENEEVLDAPLKSSTQQSSSKGKGKSRAMPDEEDRDTRATSPAEVSSSTSSSKLPRSSGLEASTSRLYLEDDEDSL